MGEFLNSNTIRQSLQNFGKTRLRSISPPKTQSRSNSPPPKSHSKLVVTGYLLFCLSLILETVIQAKNLAPKNKITNHNIVDNMISEIANSINTADPYCKLKLGDQRTQKTTVQMNTLAPRWNETFVLYVIVCNL